MFSVSYHNYKLLIRFNNIRIESLKLHIFVDDNFIDISTLFWPFDIVKLCCKLLHYFADKLKLGSTHFTVNIDFYEIRMILSQCIPDCRVFSTLSRPDHDIVCSDNPFLQLSESIHPWVNESWFIV